MEQIFIKLFNMSINAGWLVFALILLRPLIKKAPKAIGCLLWALVGLRLCLPFSVESILSLIPSAETVPPGIAYAAEPQVNTGIPFLNAAVNPILSQSMAPEPINSVNPMQAVIIIAANVWVFGMVVMTLYALISYLLLRCRLKEAVRQSENIWVCDWVDSPFLLGLFRPRIYLPSDLSEEDAAYVIAHEKAHLRRADHWWKPLGFLLLTVYWFHPLMWAAYILLCRDIEYACDEKVLRDMGAEHKKAYSQALVSCSAPRKLITPCPVAFGEKGVNGRIRSVLNYKKPAFWVILVTIALGIAVAVCFLTDPAQDKSGASFGSSNDPGDSSISLFNATVLEVTDDSLLVEPFADEEERKSSDRFWVRLPEDTTLSFAPGDAVEISYDGMIQELYPAVLPNVFSVSRLSDNLLDMPDAEDLGFYPNKEYNLVIYAYQMGQDAWRFQFMKHTKIAHTALELMNVDSIRLDQARKLLNSYNLAPEDIPVIVYCNPYSSYLYSLDSQTVQTARNLLFGQE